MRYLCVNKQKKHSFLTSKIKTMETFILKSTGTQIPFYISESGKYTAHQLEAKIFTSIQDAKNYITNGETYQILNSVSHKFVSWVN